MCQHVDPTVLIVMAIKIPLLCLAMAEESLISHMLK
jgi:hypothetical protein